MNCNFFVIENNAKDWQEAITACAQELRRRELVDDDFCSACLEREKVFPTGLETELGVAIPHTTADHVHENAICVLRLKQPVKFCRMDDPAEETEVHFVFNLAMRDSEQQLNTLRAIVRLIQDGECMKNCWKMSAEELQQTLYAKLYQ